MTDMQQQLQHTPNPGNERIVKNLMYCSGFLRHHAEGRGSQRRVLFLLRERGPMSQRDLLEEMGVRPGSLSELLSKLEAKEFITKEKSEADKRNYNVTITETGLQALQEMHAHHQEMMSDLLSGLSPEERTQLSSLLEKLRLLWQERAESGCSGHEKPCKGGRRHHKRFE